MTGAASMTKLKARIRTDQVRGEVSREGEEIAASGVGDDRVEIYTCASRGRDGLTRFQVRLTDHRTGRERCIAEITVTGDTCLLDTEPWRDQESAGNDCEESEKQ